jgi:hypothetical protein
VLVGGACCCCCCCGGGGGFAGVCAQHVAGDAACCLQRPEAQMPRQTPLAARPCCQAQHTGMPVAGATCRGVLRPCRSSSSTGFCSECCPLTAAVHAVHCAGALLRLLRHGTTWPHAAQRPPLRGGGQQGGAGGGRAGALPARPHVAAHVLRLVDQAWQQRPGGCGQRAGSAAAAGRVTATALRCSMATGSLAGLYPRTLARGASLVCIGWQCQQHPL